MIDRLKVATFIALPWLGVMYFLLGNLFGLPAAQVVMAVSLLVIAVVGIALHFKGKEYDGVVNITETDESITLMLELNEEAEDLTARKEILFRVNPPM